MCAMSSGAGDFDPLELPLNRGRKRVTGTLERGPRGLVIVTEGGDRWVLEIQDSAPALLGKQVTAEGSLAGYDRLSVDWLGEA